MTETLYTVPTRLDSAEVRAVLASACPEVADQHYVANGCLCHTYIDRASGAQVWIVEGPTTGIAVEIVGNAGLWLRIRRIGQLIAAGKQELVAGDETVPARAA